MAKAEQEQESGERGAAKPPTQFVLMDAQMQAQQLAREVAEMRAKGIRLDEAKRPGGYFLGPDGRAHDCDGNLIEEKASRGGPSSMDEVAQRRRELEEELRALSAAERRLGFEADQQAREAQAERQGIPVGNVVLGGDGQGYGTEALGGGRDVPGDPTPAKGAPERKVGAAPAPFEGKGGKAK